MNPFQLPANGVSSDWLVFLAILVAIGIGIACFCVWFFMRRKAGKRRRKRQHRHYKQHNPTLAETSGLPPARQPGEPPKGA